MKARTADPTKVGPEAAGRPSQGTSLRWLGTVDIFSKIAISLATLLLSGTIGYATLSFNRQAAQRQIQQQQDSLTLQRRTAAAQMLVNQLPAIIHGQGQERTIILRALESLDPVLVGQIGENLLRDADNPTDREEAEQIISSSSEAARALSLQQHLDNAGKYRDFGLLAAATREYMMAFESLPKATRLQLHARQAQAREAYEKGRYATSFRLFNEIFQEVAS